MHSMIFYEETGVEENLIYCFKSIRYKNTLTAKETKSEGEVMTFGFNFVKL